MPTHPQTQPLDPSQPTAPMPRGSQRDTPLRGVVWFFVILALIALILHVVVALMLGVMHDRSRSAWPAPSPVASTGESPPEPRLQRSPSLDLQTLQAGERQRLGGYGWVDRPRGVVRLPIERAMELEAQPDAPSLQERK